MKYAIVTPAGRIENVIVYDGQAPLEQPEGWSVIPLPEGAWIGWTRADDGWTAPPPEPAAMEV